MMDKTIPALHDSSIIFDSSEGMNKVASLGTFIPPKLAHHIREIEKNPDPNYVYLYDRALGAGEYYGANNNGDWFGEEMLRRDHESFEKSARLYRHHQNKDPRNSIGEVLASAYNDPLHTVDLIIKAPLEKVAQDMDDFANGKQIQTSMGAKVPYDVCSVCGNKAKTRGQYCSHLRFNMLKLMPDGRQVFAKNEKGEFVDISIVLVHADPASVVLRKIASEQKMGQMAKKDVGQNIESERRNVLNPHIIEAMDHMSRADVLATLHASHGILRPDEFQAILRKDAGCIRHGMIPYVTFTEVPKQAMAGNVNHALVRAFSEVPDMPLVKNASHQHATFLTNEEKEAYLKYRKSTGHFSRMFVR